MPKDLFSNVGRAQHRPYTGSSWAASEARISSAELTTEGPSLALSQLCPWCQWYHHLRKALTTEHVPKALCSDHKSCFLSTESLLICQVLRIFPKGTYLTKRLPVRAWWQTLTWNKRVSEDGKRTFLQSDLYDPDRSTRPGHSHVVEVTSQGKILLLSNLVLFAASTTYGINCIGLGCNYDCRALFTENQ